MPLHPRHQSFQVCRDFHQTNIRAGAVPIDRTVPAEVSTRNDVQQTIRRCGVGVVVAREKVAIQVVGHPKGIPVTSGLPGQLCSVCAAAVCRSTFVAARDLRSVTANKYIIKTKIFTETKRQPFRCGRINGETSNSIVRIFTISFTGNDSFRRSISLLLCCRIQKTADERTGADVEMAIGSK